MPGAFQAAQEWVQGHQGQVDQVINNLDTDEPLFYLAAYAALEMTYREQEPVRGEVAIRSYNYLDSTTIKGFFRRYFPNITNNLPPELNDLRQYVNRGRNSTSNTSFCDFIHNIHHVLNILKFRREQDAVRDDGRSVYSFGLDDYISQLNGNGTGRDIQDLISVIRNASPHNWQGLPENLTKEQRNNPNFLDNLLMYLPMGRNQNDNSSYSDIGLTQEEHPIVDGYIVSTTEIAGLTTTTDDQDIKRPIQQDGFNSEALSQLSSETKIAQAFYKSSREVNTQMQRELHHIFTDHPDVGATGISFVYDSNGQGTEILYSSNVGDSRQRIVAYNAEGDVRIIPLSFDAESDYLTRQYVASCGGEFDNRAKLNARGNQGAPLSTPKSFGHRSGHFPGLSIEPVIMRFDITAIRQSLAQEGYTKIGILQTCDGIYENLAFCGNPIIGLEGGIDRVQSDERFYAPVISHAITTGRRIDEAVVFAAGNSGSGDNITARFIELTGQKARIKLDLADGHGNKGRIPERADEPDHDPANNLGRMPAAYFVDNHTRIFNDISRRYERVQARNTGAAAPAAGGGFGAHNPYAPNNQYNGLNPGQAAGTRNPTDLSQYEDQPKEDKKKGVLDTSQGKAGAGFAAAGTGGAALFLFLVLFVALDPILLVPAAICLVGGWGLGGGMILNKKSQLKHEQAPPDDDHKYHGSEQQRDPVNTQHTCSLQVDRPWLQTIGQDGPNQWIR